jgi:hypothetical protein
MSNLRRSRFMSVIPALLSLAAAVLLAACNNGGGGSGY